MATLMVNINGQEYTDMSNFLSVSYEQTILDCTVYTDGSELVNHYRVECSDDWIELRRIRNVITIIVKKNDGYDARSGSISFYHNLDSSVNVSFVVIQSACEYSISVDENEIEFDTLLDKTDPNEEVAKITVTANNGTCDFIIPSIREYAKNDGDEDFYLVKYDKGLKLEKIGNNKLQITNYGKVSLYDDNYYIIKICHRNNPKSNVDVKVVFVPNHTIGIAFDDGD